MVVRGKEFDDINDLVAIRVVVESEKDCWAALGAIHAIWAPVHGRFKDYINTPKFNMYQSLHTTVIGLDGKPVEVQIRTSEMHHRAEYGIAAHWGYKSKEDHSSEMAWLQRIADVDRQTDDPIEFLEALKLDLEQDEVYVFTPKGKVIALPARSTPVDFAYAIHTEVGHRCIGARVNGRLVPLETQLTSADTVEIFTSKSPTAGPSRDWLQIVASTRARNKIRQWFSRERREDAIENGREDLARALRRDGLPLHKLLGSTALQEVADAMNLADLDALYASIGENQVSAQSIVQRLIKALRGGGEADEQLPTIALPGTSRPAPEPPHGHRRLRRGARRRHDPPGPLLHAGAGRPDRGLRDPGPGRLGAPGRLRQRGGAGRPLPGAPHGGRVGPGQRRRLRGDHRGAGLRPGPPAGRRVPGGLRAPPQHRGRPHRHDAGPGQPDGLRRRAGRPDPPAFTDQRAEAPRRGVRRVSSASWQESLTPTSEEPSVSPGSSAPEPTSGRAAAAPRAKGMHDVLWPESARWEATVARFAGLVEGAGYGLTITPILEHAGVFLRGIGEGSEVVGKEMYVFEDRDGQLMALRPEGTAPIARAYVQHHPVPPWKAWYVAPSFRHENPQHGRYRQHHQLGVEALGPADADLDVEVVSLAHDFFAGLGLRQVTLEVALHGRRRLPAGLRRAR